MRIILQLVILTGMRGGEVCSLQTAYINDLEGPAPIIVIPGDRLENGRRVKGAMKAGREHRVPLSQQCVSLVRRALELCEGDAFLFPARAFTEMSKFPHVDRHSLSRAMKRLCDKLGIDDAHAHDFRRTIASWLGDLGERPDVISRILAHTPQDITARVYNHSRLDPLVREALQRWADHVDGLRAVDMGGSVIDGPWQGEAQAPLSGG
jgi:integrase